MKYLLPIILLIYSGCSNSSRPHKHIMEIYDINLVTMRVLSRCRGCNKITVNPLIINKVVNP